MRQNRHELADFIKFARSKGLGWKTNYLLDNSNHPRNYQRLRISDHSFYSLKMKVLHKYLFQTCPVPFSHMYVTFDGDVILCSLDWQRQGVVGNLRSSTLEKIWNSRLYNGLRKKMIKKTYADVECCRGCTNTRLSV